MRAARTSPGYQLFMLVLCAYALVALAVQTAVRLDPAIRDILDYADYALCLLFFIDFLVNLVTAKNRWKYLITWGWVDLLSSLPTLDIARWGRLTRILRIVRLLRGVRATKLLVGVLAQKRRENGLLAATVVAILLVIFSSIAVLHFESAANGNINTAEKAIWWAFATITTVGYGDVYPTTSEGRFVAAVLMFSGVGLFGVFSGILASWFVGDEKVDVGTELRSLREEVAALRAALSDAKPAPPGDHERST